jgi:methyl-accepting chemotaxis protein
MEELKESSRRITSDAQDVTAGVAEVGDHIETIGRISEEVVANIGEISLGLQEISRTVHAADDQARQLQETATILEAAAQRFQID